MVCGGPAHWILRRGAGPQAQWTHVGFNCCLDVALVWTKAVSDETDKDEFTSIQEEQYVQCVT